MKAFITRLLKGRIIRWSVLAAVLAAAGLSVAWLGPVHYRLGGGFIGEPARSGGMLWSAYQAPLDAAGMTAALRVNMISWGPDLAGLLAYAGADTFGEGIGQLAMISDDTAKGSLVFYGLKQGNPPEVKAIIVFEGTTKFTSPNTYDVRGTTSFYLAATDGDGDGRPDPGSTPFYAAPGQLGVTRVLP